MLWYADNSELKGISEELPDMLLFGGIAVPAASEAKLRMAVEAVKARHFDIRAPIKWNFKDLRPTYEKSGLMTQYEEMLSKSQDWRRQVFEVLAEFDCTVITSVVQSNSLKKDVYKDVRPALVRYSFSNCLMRLALHVQETRPTRCQVILDWPENHDGSPFNNEYATAYREGRTLVDGMKYHAGPLCDLGFTDSVAYANMRHTTMLQVADLALGATREFLECALGKREKALGLALCRVIAPKFRGHDRGSIFGYGISVASGDEEFKGRIREYINANLFVDAQKAS